MSRTFEEAYAVTSHMCPDVYTFEEPECRKYWELLTQLDPTSVVVEIGLQFGRSSTLVAQVAKEIGFQHIGIDPFIDPPSAEGVWTRNMEGLNHCPTLLNMFSNDPRIRRMLPQIVDIALIDGDHWETGWKSDIELLQGRIRHEAGALLFHDYGVNLPRVYPRVDPDSVRDYMSQFPGWWEEMPVGCLGIWRIL